MELELEAEPDALASSAETESGCNDVDVLAPAEAEPYRAASVADKMVPLIAPLVLALGEGDGCAPSLEAPVGREGGDEEDDEGSDCLLCWYG